jgi:Ca2+-binding RTX toxin-like protein
MVEMATPVDIETSCFDEAEPAQVGICVSQITRRRFAMTRSFFGRMFGIVGVGQVGRDRKARPRRLQPSVDGLERRDLLTGSVTLSAGVVTVLPDSAARQNTAIVANGTGTHAGQLDIQLNGTDNYFAAGSVMMVFFDGYGLNTDVTFQNNTSVTTIAYGGNGTNVFSGGSGVDEFIGGSGSNTFNAGTGFDILAGGSGTNVYNESSGSGMIFEVGSHNTIHGGTGSYSVY